MRSMSDLLTTAEVAERCRVSVATVNRWAASGALPVAMQLPGATGARLYRPTDVEALIHDTQDAS